MTDSASPAEERPDIEVLTDADGVVIGYAAHSPEGAAALTASPAEERPLTLREAIKSDLTALAHWTREDWHERGRGGDPIARTINAARDIVDARFALASVTDDERLDALAEALREEFEDEVGDMDLDLWRVSAVNITERLRR